MGSKERREREKLATKQSILKAARQIAMQEGWQAVTIRRVAEQIEYSPPIIYEYFDNKESLLIAIMKEGFQQLATGMRYAVGEERSGEERVIRVADAYWQFAKNNPDLYQVMHGLGGTALDTTQRGIAVQEVCQIVVEALQRWAREVEIELPDIYDKAEMVWSFLHGQASLAVLERFTGGEERALKLMHQGIKDWLTSWRCEQEA